MVHLTIEMLEQLTSNLVENAETIGLITPDVNEILEILKYSKTNKQSLDGDYLAVSLTRIKFNKLLKELFEGIPVSKIKQLDLIGCGIEEIDYDFLTQFSSLVFLNLQSNKLQNFDYSVIHKLQSIKSIDLFGNDIEYHKYELEKELEKTGRSISITFTDHDNKSTEYTIFS